MENDDKSESKKEEGKWYFWSGCFRGLLLLGNANKHDNKIPEFNYGSQFKALIAKTLVLQQRQYKTNACQVLFPLVLMIVLFLIQGLVNSTIKNESGEFTYVTFKYHIVTLNYKKYFKTINTMKNIVFKFF